MPTYLYTYEQAVKDKYLVDYNFTPRRLAFSARFTRREPSEEERNLLIQHGLDPDEINYEGTELEEKVTVTDMLRRQWQEIMEVVYKDSSGTCLQNDCFCHDQKTCLALARCFL